MGLVANLKDKTRLTRKEFLERFPISDNTKEIAEAILLISDRKRNSRYFGNKAVLYVYKNGHDMYHGVELVHKSGSQRLAMIEAIEWMETFGFKLAPWYP